MRGDWSERLQQLRRMLRGSEDGVSGGFEGSRGRCGEIEGSLLWVWR